MTFLWQWQVCMMTGWDLTNGDAFKMKTGNDNHFLMHCSFSTEFRNTSYRYTDSALRRENERNLFLRQKPPSGRLHRQPAMRLNRREPLIRQTGIGGAAGRGLLGSPRLTTRREIAHEKTTQIHPREWTPLTISSSLLVLNTMCLLATTKFNSPDLFSKPQTK